MNYFSHDSNARNDERILRLRMKHGAAGYGVFFMILERMRDSTNYMCATDYRAISFDLRVDPELIRSVVEDYELFLFTDDREFFYSSSLLKRMEKIEEIGRKRSEAGRRGGRPRKLVVEVPTEATVPCGSPQGSPPTTDPSASAGGNEDYFEELHRPSYMRDNMCMLFHLTTEQLEEKLSTFLLDCQCRQTVHQDRRDAINHFNDWLRIVIEAEKKQKDEQSTKSNQANRRRGVQKLAPTSEDYGGAF